MARFAAASHETVTLAGMQIRPAINYHSRGNQPRVIVNLDAKFHERERERERERKKRKNPDLVFDGRIEEEENLIFFSIFFVGNCRCNGVVTRYVQKSNTEE